MDTIREFQHLKLRMKRSGAFLRRNIHGQGMRALKYALPQGAPPDMLIVGAMKCGTTTLFQMLTQHPGFMPPVAKEIHYFNHPGHHRRGERWYRAHFPSERSIQRHALRLGYRPLTGEASPAMSSPMYPENAARLVPDARRVVTLRNPVDRAYSHYQHMLHHPQPEPLEFRAALDRELDLLENGAIITQENYRTLAPLLLKFGYLNRGRYALELEHWLRSNQGTYREQIPEDCTARLTDYYRPWNRRLFDLLGEDWDWPC